jgi:hypothetical protein
MPRETGTVRRQPSNPYDSNAIAVYSPHGGIQIGHIKRQVAAVLAPLMDHHGLRLEPRVTSLGEYTIQCDLDFFSPQAAVAAVHNAIRALPSFLRLPWLNFDPNAGPASAPPLAARIAVRAPVPQPAGTVYTSGGAIPNGGAGVAHRSSVGVPGSSYGAPTSSFEALVAGARGTDALFEQASYELQPAAPQPALLTTLLLPHQLKAVFWMLQRERIGSVSMALTALTAQRSAVVPTVSGESLGQQFLFWQRKQGGGFFNVLTQV